MKFEALLSPGHRPISLYSSYLLVFAAAFILGGLGRHCQGMVMFLGWLAHRSPQSRRRVYMTHNSLWIGKTLKATVDSLWVTNTVSVAQKLWPNSSDTAGLNQIYKHAGEPQRSEILRRRTAIIYEYK